MLKYRSWPWKKMSTTEFGNRFKKQSPKKGMNRLIKSRWEEVFESGVLLFFLVSWVHFGDSCCVLHRKGFNCPSPKFSLSVNEWKLGMNKRLKQVILTSKINFSYIQDTNEQSAYFIMTGFQNGKHKFKKIILMDRDELLQFEWLALENEFCQWFSTENYWIKWIEWLVYGISLSI